MQTCMLTGLDGWHRLCCFVFAGTQVANIWLHILPMEAEQPSKLEISQDVLLWLVPPMQALQPLLHLLDGS